MTTASTFKWNGERYSQALRDEMKLRLERVGRMLVRRVKSNLAVPGPPHSRDGEFPHKISGLLQMEVQSKLDRRSLSVQVFDTASYAEFVEKRRPFLRRTMREMRSEIRAVMLSKLPQSGRFLFTD